MHRHMTGTLLAIASLAGLAHGDEKEAPSLTIGDKAPPLDVAHWVRGEPLKRLDEGKVYVVSFFLSTHGPSRAHLPTVLALSAKHGKKAVFVGLSHEALPTFVHFLCGEAGTPEVRHYDRMPFRLGTDPDRSVQRDYVAATGFAAVPLSFIVGRDTRIEWIGYPGNLGAPLEAVLAGTWDRGAFRKTWKASVERRKDIQKRNLEIARAKQSGDLKRAEELLRSAIAKHSTAGLRLERFRVLLLMDRAEEAYAVGDKLVEFAWKFPGLLNVIAWYVVGDDKVKTRNLAFALKAAERANELTKGRDAAILDTVARVHYLSGDLDRALEFQRASVERGGEHPEMGKELRERLVQYEREKARSE